MEIGKRIYYDKVTGNIILDTDKMNGNVENVTIQSDFEIYPELKNRTLENTGIIQLAYGERGTEFSNMGSMRVENGQLIIYPRVII